MNRKEFEALVAKTEGVFTSSLLVKAGQGGHMTQVYIQVPEHRYIDPENHPLQQKVVANTMQTGYFSSLKWEAFAHAFSTFPEFRQAAIEARADCDVFQELTAEAQSETHKAKAEIEELREALDGPKTRLWSRLTNERNKHHATQCSLGIVKAQRDKLTEALRRCMDVIHDVYGGDDHVASGSASADKVYKQAITALETSGFELHEKGGS